MDKEERQDEKQKVKLFRLIPSNGKRSKIPARMEIKSTDNDVEKFMEKFHELCRCKSCSQIIQDLQLYSKEEFVKKNRYKQNKIKQEQMIMLLCDCGILFSRDFDCVPSGNRLKNFLLNKEFIHDQKKLQLDDAKILERIETKWLQDRPDLVEHFQAFTSD